MKGDDIPFYMKSGKQLCFKHSTNCSFTMRLKIWLDRIGENLLHRLNDLKAVIQFYLS